MVLQLFRRIVGYNGSMEYKQQIDEEVVADYQHTYVVDHFREYFEGKDVLDAGCWTGTLERALEGRGIKATVRGIDDNKDALKTARKTFPQHTFRQCNLVSPPEGFIREENGRYDSVVFLDVIEHLPRGSECAVLRVLHGVLKESGVLIMSTMAHHMMNVVDPAWLVGHRHYRVGTLERLLGASGFQPREVMRIGNIYWDIDLLIFYTYKHILRKRYRRSQGMIRRIERGFRKSWRSTRIYLVAQKKGGSY